MPALVKEGEEEGLHRIVKVVAQSDLVDAVVHECVVEGAPAHFAHMEQGFFSLRRSKMMW